MKEARVFKGPRVEIHDVAIPSPKPDEVLIKVIFSGSNPKDWKMSEWVAEQDGTNQGDDIAGYVQSVGKNVAEYKPGDRVAAFHVMRTPSGSYAEYAISPAHTVFHIPDKTSFEEAATIPLAAMTAAIGLFVRMGLPEPWQSTSERRQKTGVDGGLVVYGGASAVGAFGIKLAVRANIHPIIAVAGRGTSFVESLIDKSKGDAVVDYRKGDDSVVEGIKAVLPLGKELRYCLDATSEHNSYQNMYKVLSTNGGKITTVLPGKEYHTPSGIEQSLTTVGSAHTDLKDFAFAWFRLMSLGLQDGWFSGHPHEVMPGGLAGVQGALKNLKDGKASAVKYVFRIEDTEGVSKDHAKI
ncbi:MAG: hypothetical protein Q9227_005493 [Pyrenula ochraceoflavens]